MTKNKLSAQSIWKEYERDVRYKTSLGLFEKVKQQQNFFLGRQWEGLNAPDLEKPVLNFVKRVVSYLISVLVVDDIGVSFRGSGSEELDYTVLRKEIDRVNENCKFRPKLRSIIKNAAVDGDGCMYMRYNARTTEIESEVVPGTNVVFGDRTMPEVEKQPYIILVKKVLTATLKEKYPHLADSFRGGVGVGASMDGDEERETVLVRFYKKDEIVCFTQSVQEAFLTTETVTGQRLYPVSFMNWEEIRDSYHGMGAVETIIPNQIAVNKLWAMALLYEKNNAFPKIFIDKTKIDRWNNSVGAVIGVVGSPNDAVATSFKPHDMASQLMAIVEKTISYTKDFMGANDAALGNVNPNNTSAIMALQKSSAAPLELQRLSLYQFVEDYARIVYDIIKTHYGLRMHQSEEGEGFVDFGKLQGNAQLIVEIGASEYWSESAQVVTMDNLFTKGIITDAVTYLENIPSKSLPNKNKLIAQVKEAKEDREQLAAEAGELATGERRDKGGSSLVL